MTENTPEQKIDDDATPDAAQAPVAQPTSELVNAEPAEESTVSIGPLPPLSDFEEVAPASAPVMHFTDPPDEGDADVPQGDNAFDDAEEVAEDAEGAAEAEPDESQTPEVEPTPEPVNATAPQPTGRQTRSANVPKMPPVAGGAEVGNGEGMSTKQVLALMGATVAAALVLVALGGAIVYVLIGGNTPDTQQGATTTLSDGSQVISYGGVDVSVSKDASDFAAGVIQKRLDAGEKLVGELDKDTLTIGFRKKPADEQRSDEATASTALDNLEAHRKAAMNR